MTSPPFAADAVDPALLPIEELADCAATALAADGARILSYGPGAGYTPLRELIGEWFGVNPGRVLLTNGSLQALSLLARRVRGRSVVAEYPVADRVERALLDAGVVLVSVEVDAEGLVTDQLRQQLTEYLRPAIVYTIPGFHNPTGALLSVARRRTLVELVAAQNRIQLEQILLVEDDNYGLTRFEGERLPSVFDLSGRMSAYVSSFSATVAPGLRVGWLILPDAEAAELAVAATDAYVTPVLAAQATVYEFIRRGSFEPHLHRLREGLRLRRDTLTAALERQIPDAGWTKPEGGLFLWMKLPFGTDGRRLVEQAGVGFAVPGTAFASTANMLRLSFGSVPPEEIEDGIERLAIAYFSTTK